MLCSRRFNDRVAISRWPVLGRLHLAAILPLMIGLWLSPQPLTMAQSLPDEGQLPVPSATVDDTAPTEQVLPSQPSAELPSAEVSEGELPGGAELAKPLGDGLELTGDLRPRLRLVFDGHTGVIRALSISDNGKLLTSAGEDKDLHVWSPEAATAAGWFHRRTVRWPIDRGPRGRIYTVATRGSEIALAGHGALGGLGEIWIVDGLSGDLVRSLVGADEAHQQVIVSLAWAPDGSSRLVSADIEGKVMLWQADAATGLWSGRVVVAQDAVTYGEAIAPALAPRRGFVPVAWLGSDAIVVPHYSGVATQPAGAAAWKLQRIDLTSGQLQLISAPELIEYAITLVATRDGKRLVCSDAFGTTTLVEFSEDGTVSRSESLAVGATPLSATLNADGSRLLLGTAAVPNAAGVSRGTIQWWDLDAQPAKKLSQSELDEHVRGVAWHPERQEVIAAVGNRIAIHQLDAQEQLGASPSGMLQVGANGIRRVLFHKDPQKYQIALSSGIAPAASPDAPPAPVIDNLFDLDELRLLPTSSATPDDYLPSQRLEQRWSVRPTATPGGLRYRFHEADQPRGLLPFQEQLHGVPTSLATLAIPSGPAPEAAPPGGATTTTPGLPEIGATPESGATPETDASATNADAANRDVVIVGTSGRNNIYVYAADPSDPPRLLRQFRGHQGEVLSLATSADGRYLVSSSSDATISVWKLGDLLSASETGNRWGVDFEIENQQLIASRLRDDGPLYFRGVRGGDVLIAIRWADEQGEAFAETDPARMLERLRSLPFDTLVVFEFTRLGRALAGFQSFAAWQPLATLFVDPHREWAFWTPAGFYNASFNGHRRFGWQINRGVNQLPDYFRAAQFRELLERPAVMRRLLRAGSLEQAMRETVGGIGPPPGESAIVNQYLSRPVIEVVSPRPNVVVDGSEIDVVAKITVPLGATLRDPRSFANGVPAVERELISSESTESGQLLTYRWKQRLPRDPQIKMEVIAATEAAAVGRVTVDFGHTSRPAKTPPRLHLLAIGVSRYRDRQIQSLDFAASATDVVANLFRTHASPLYRVSTDQLVDDQATRPMWRVYASQAAEELSRTVGPDDLVVMYLCGHGLRDRLTGQWYFVTADARYDDLMNDRYGDCLSFDDLAALSKLPCRKLAILDSCHSGAVQPLMRSDDLKSALRFLQDDVVLTLTASEGDEEAAEQRESQLGRFTTHLVQGLQGGADREGNADGVVSLRETVAYVTRRVGEAAENEGADQHPTASPEYLLETLDLPLTSSRLAP